MQLHNNVFQLLSGLPIISIVQTNWDTYLLSEDCSSWVLEALTSKRGSSLSLGLSKSLGGNLLEHTWYFSLAVLWDLYPNGSNNGVSIFILIYHLQSPIFSCKQTRNKGKKPQGQEGTPFYQPVREPPTKHGPKPSCFMTPQSTTLLLPFVVRCLLLKKEPQNTLFKFVWLSKTW